MENIEQVRDVNLSNITNTKTGSLAKVIYYPKNKQELLLLVEELRNNNENPVVLGSFTNVAFSSKKFDRPIISMEKFENESITYDPERRIVTVGAGYQMKQLAIWGLKHHINAFQWMEGIPGTVGAGTYMNAGFLSGQDFWSFMVDTEVLMPDMKIVNFKNNDLHYSYRYSELQNNGGIVLSTRFLVRGGKKWKIKAKMYQYHQRRAKSQPLEYPSAGTVFVPPTPYHVGGMLRQLGLIGHQIGGARISEKSPGFIINTGDMTGEDYYQMVKFIQKSIKDKFDIDLTPEVRLFGFEDEK